jgi:hypothetical protein
MSTTGSAYIKTLINPSRVIFCASVGAGFILKIFWLMMNEKGVGEPDTAGNNYQRYQEDQNANGDLF